MNDLPGQATALEHRPSLEPAILKADGLVKHYPDGNVQALRGVSLEIAEGEFAAITGPSGCGKSTLLHLLGGLDRPDAGEVRFRGQPLSRIDLDAFHARQVGFVFQSFYLMPTLTAIENVQIPMFEGPWPRSERADAPPISWSRWAWSTGTGTGPPSSPSASGSGSPSPGRWPTTPSCSSPTSRPVTWTARVRTRSSASSPSFANAGTSPSSSSPTARTSPGPPIVASP